MTERKAGQDGLAAESGQVRRGWHWWVDSDGNGCWKRDADDFIRAAGLRDEGYYGNSPLATLNAPPKFRGRHTKPLIPKDSS